MLLSELRSWPDADPGVPRTAAGEQWELTTCLLLYNSSLNGQLQCPGKLIQGQHVYLLI